MTWQSLLNPDIQKFIREHENADVAALALKKPPDPGWNYPLILDQIKSRQKARTKLPLWPDHHPDIIFPPSNILEQASSAATARYKAGLIKGKTFIDFTGGAGVDSCALTEHYESGIIIDSNETAATLIAHNLPLLCRPGIKLDIRCAKAEDFIKDMPNTDLALIDPQRRDTKTKGKFILESTAPSVLELLPALLEKARHIILKTSPMLDIAQTIKDLKHVHSVHIVEWRGDCKELLFILNRGTTEEPLITAASINDTGDTVSQLIFTAEEEKSANAPLSMPLKYLYEPGPAFQKSGSFQTIAERFNLHKLHAHTHLYTSNTLRPDFPGRCFEIIGQYPVKAQKVPLKQAHITTRNFPLDTATLRKKLKLKDGGKDYLFACTLMDGSKTLLHGRKA
ncbi:MAG: class I SAM-dependent methyltransferase [Alphaproteobacteria bacterium]